MTDKPLRLIDRHEKERTQFGDVLSSLAADRKLNKRELSAELGCSPSTLSLVGSGQRGLSQQLADALAQKLGGTSELWAQIYDETKSGRVRSLTQYRTLLKEDGSISRFPGARVRRLRRSHMETLLEQPELEPDHEGNRNVFRIDPFSASQIRETSFDTTLGAVIMFGSNRSQPIGSAIEVLPMSSAIGRTAEAITMPLWMEAEVHPATSLARKHLIVSGGPIIDPGFDGFLEAAVFNPTPEPIRITPTEPFLTLRFWIQEID